MTVKRLSILDFILLVVIGWSTTIVGVWQVVKIGREETIENRKAIEANRVILEGNRAILERIECQPPPEGKP